MVSSYNWIGGENETPKTLRDNPTIAVPGCPNFWSPPNGSRQLRHDNGLTFINQNSARYPKRPLEPLFRALEMTHPTFDVRTVHLVTDRNIIRKLLGFIERKIPGTKVLQSFEFEYEMVKDTALFCRKEKEDYVVLKGFHGFGHQFEKTYTKEKIKNSTSHHQVVSYELGGLNILLRHEVDACVPSNDYTVIPYGPYSESPVQPAGSDLKVKIMGNYVPYWCTVEIKTRSMSAIKDFDIRSFMPQLWVSQTRNLVMAFHVNGSFNTPMIKDVSDEIQYWERDNQALLGLLVALLNKIIAVIKQDGYRKGVIKYDYASDTLFICPVMSKSMLTPDLYAKWDDASKHEEAVTDVGGAGSFDESAPAQVVDDVDVSKNEKAVTDVGGVGSLNESAPAQVVDSVKGPVPGGDGSASVDDGQDQNLGDEGGVMFNCEKVSVDC